MREYQSINYFKHKYNGRSIVAFYKYDGNNIRVEHRKNKGFVKFGSRTKLIDETHTQFGEAVRMFKSEYQHQLQEIINNNKKLSTANELVFFFEYYGDHSFAGKHVEGDTMHLILIDMWNKKPVDPEEFIELFFNKVPIAGIVYRGILDDEFIKYVKSDTQQFSEGVVCKGRNLIFKLKTDAWLNRCKSELGDARYKEELR